MRLSKIKKEKEEVDVRNIKTTNEIENITCEKKILVDKKIVLDSEDKKVQEDVKKLNRNIEEQESKLKDLIKTEQDAIKTIKNLTTLRGSHQF